MPFYKALSLGDRKLALPRVDGIPAKQEFCLGIPQEVDRAAYLRSTSIFSLRAGGYRNYPAGRYHIWVEPKLFACGSVFILRVHSQTKEVS